MKKMLIISTGGTIAQVKDQRTGASVISHQSNRDAEMFAKLLESELKDSDFTVSSEAILNKDSSNVVPEDWVKIINTIVDKYEDFDSFLITHGTNTLAYTCAALSFALGGLGKPVVLTGSQIPYGQSGSDALVNLQNAARVAMTTKNSLAGVVAVFGSKIITGTRVKKITEFDYDGFKSFSSTQPIGYVGRAIKFNQEALSKHLDLYKDCAKTREQLDISKKFNYDSIVCLTEHPGLNPKIFECLVEDAKVEGFILRAVGAGDPNVMTEKELKAYEEERKSTYVNLRGVFEYLRNRKIPIVVTTQAPDGVASMDVNDTGIEAYNLGAIPAYDMSIEATIVKFSWLLGRKIKYDEMRRQMTTSLKGEIVKSSL